MMPMLILGLAMMSLLYVAYVFYMQIVFWILVVLFVFVLGWIYRYLCQLGLQRYQIDVDDNGGIVLRQFDAVSTALNSRVVFLCFPVIIWPYLIVLSVVGEDNKKQRLIIVCDSVDCDGFRRLAVVALCLSRRAQQIGDERNGMSVGNF
jgi:hypothetical protein